MARRTSDLHSAIARLAALFPFGALQADTDPAGFLGTVADELERLRAAPPDPPTPDAKVDVEIIRGVGGFCVAVNGTRIAGQKPWGGGKVVASWEVAAGDIRDALPAAPPEAPASETAEPALTFDEDGAATGWVSHVSPAPRSPSSSSTRTDHEEMDCTCIAPNPACPNCNGTGRYQR